MRYRSEIAVSPRGYTHVLYGDWQSYTFCGHEFPLEKKGWRKLRDDEKMSITCKVCARGKAGY